MHHAQAALVAACVAIVPSLPASAQMSPPAQRGFTYVRVHCARCHSIDRVTPSPLTIAPPFRTLHERYPVESLQEALAEGIRKRCKSTLGIGITGIAGPTGGTEEKPVGLVYTAITDGKKTEIVETRFPGDRDRIRRFASQQALDMIRRKLK